MAQLAGVFRMESLMIRLHLAAVTAAALTASQILVVRASVKTLPALLARLRSRGKRCLRRMRGFLDDRVAAMIAEHERNAAIFVTHDRGDRRSKKTRFDPGDGSRAGRPAAQARRGETVNRRPYVRLTEIVR